MRDNPHRLYLLFSSRGEWRRYSQQSSGQSFRRRSQFARYANDFLLVDRPTQYEKNYRQVTFASDGLRLLDKLLSPLRHRQTNQRTRD